MSVSAAANQAPTAANPGVGELFRTVGAEIHRRLAEVAGGDEARTRADAQVLFVRFYLRFVIRRAADARDAGARWAWIYRVATLQALRSLPSGACPGDHAAASAPLPLSPGARLPTMQALRAFDEATQVIVVLACLDRLSEREIAEVLELSPDLVRRKLSDARAKGLEIAAAAGAPPTTGE